MRPDLNVLTVVLDTFQLHQKLYYPTNKKSNNYVLTESSNTNFATGPTNRGRPFDSSLEDQGNEIVADKACDELDSFMKGVGMWFGQAVFVIPENKLDDLAKQSLVLPDYNKNPPVATLEETKELLQQCYHR